MRKLLALPWILALVMSVHASAFAGDDHDDGDEDCHDGQCEVKTKTECFNVVCYFKDWDKDGKEERCKAASTFTKEVTRQGGEVQDQSNKKNHPTLEVSCDGKSPFYNNSAHRFTDLLGTRIQGQTGPHPSISLPRGALHSGADDGAGYHVSQARLEFDRGDMGDKQEAMNGVCHIWTGAP